MTPTLRRTVAAAAFALTAALAPAPAAAQGTVIPPITELLPLRSAVDSAGYRATVVVYDVRRNRYQAVHAERAARRLIPASTFKIVNALAALDLGVVAGPAGADVVAVPSIKQRSKYGREYRT